MYIHILVHVEVDHMLVGYIATMYWGVGRGTGVSVGGVSLLSLSMCLNHCPLLSLAPEWTKQEVM